MTKKKKNKIEKKEEYMKLITLDNLNHFKEKLEKLNATKEELNAIKETLKPSVFNLIYPVGVTYVQYPQQASPNDLWGTFSTWKVVDYSGAFFRAEGGNANPFIEESGVLSKQGDSIKAHSHPFSGTTGGMSANSTGTVRSTHEGLFNGRRLEWSGNTTLSGSTDWSGGDNSAGGKPTTMTINVAHTHGYSGTTSNTGSNETRPENFTIRIWKRTA